MIKRCDKDSHSWRHVPIIAWRAIDSYAYLLASWLLRG
jgi:hypothetical protein